MGNIYAESGLSSINLQNSFEKKLGYTDASYTSGVDAGTYTNFVRDSAGYGLCQWTYWSRKQALLEFCHSKGTSIGDLEMQLEFMYKELSENYGTVMSVLRSATTVLQASNSVLLHALQTKALPYRARGLHTDRYIMTNLLQKQISKKEVKLWDTQTVHL